MEFDSSVLMYFVHASVIVKCVMLLLLGASIASWTIFFQSGVSLKAAKNAAAKFEHIFWSGGDLSHLHHEITQHKNELNGLEGIFSAGFKEYLRLHKQPGVTAEHVVEGAQRAMRSVNSRELEKLESPLPFLGMVGSASPYVGLFGTIWGIMMSFNSLSHVQQVTIAMVAPGIAEALIATAMGLFAAIPAVIIYNRFANDIKKLQNRFEIFQEEFANILFRQAQQSIVKNNSGVMV